MPLTDQLAFNVKVRINTLRSRIAALPLNMILNLVHFCLLLREKSLNFIALFTHTQLFFNIIHVNQSLFAAILAENLAANPTVVPPKEDVKALPAMLAVESLVIWDPFCFLEILHVGQVLDGQQTFRFVVQFAFLFHI